MVLHVKPLPVAIQPRPCQAPVVRRHVEAQFGAGQGVECPELGGDSDVSCAMECVVESDGVGLPTADEQPLRRVIPGATGCNALVWVEDTSADELQRANCTTRWAKTDRERARGGGGGGG